VVAAAALLAVGCGSPAAPPPSPGGFGDVIGELVLRGVTVQQHVSGDDGCPTVELHDNAARLSVSYGSTSRVFDVYVFRWRRASDFENEADAFAACAQEHGAQHPQAQLSTIEASPWRAYGTDWPPELRRAVDQALFEAGGG
jgi:hypothetical protein